MQINLPVTSVDLAHVTYFKAAAVVEDNIIIVRNLVGSVLEILTLDEPVEEVLNAQTATTGRVFRGVVDGSPVIVTELYDCQCGGTRITHK